MSMIHTISDFFRRGHAGGNQGLSDLSIGVLEPESNEKGGETAEKSFAAYADPFEYLGVRGVADATPHELSAAFLAVYDRLPSLREQRALVRTAASWQILR